MIRTYLRVTTKTSHWLCLLAILCLGSPLAACSLLEPVTSTGDGPEFGIYWFGKDDANQLAIPDMPNPYYDPARPAILFVHGWQPNQAYTHRTMLWEFENAGTGQEEVLDLAAPWIDAGWNLGVFDWGPFADEEIVLDAEAKIWTAEGKKAKEKKSHTSEARRGYLK